MTKAKKSSLKDWVGVVEREFSSANLCFGHGAANARDEAAWLVFYAARLAPTDLVSAWSRPANAREQRRIASLVQRRISSRLPLAYLLKEAWLGGVRFHVNRQVIIPRSYITELLQDELRPWCTRPGSIRKILDLCTGSACLAVLAAKTFSKSHVHAVDISKAALRLARRNVMAHDLESRISLIHSDLFCGLTGEKYDLIISNPPYVSAEAMGRLPAEYQYEPAIALAGGDDGLDIVDAILRESVHYLKHGGHLLLEIGHGQTKFEKRYRGLDVTWPLIGSNFYPLVWIEQRALARYFRSS